MNEQDCRRSPLSTKQYQICLSLRDNIKEYFWHKFTRNFIHDYFDLYVFLQSASFPRSIGEMARIIKGIHHFLETEDKNQLFLLFYNFKVISNKEITEFLIYLNHSASSWLTIVLEENHMPSDVGIHQQKEKMNTYSSNPNEKCSLKQFQIQPIHLKSFYHFTEDSSKAAAYFLKFWQDVYDRNMNIYSFNLHLIAWLNSAYLCRLNLQQQRTLFFLGEAGCVSELFIKDIFMEQANEVLDFLENCPFVVRLAGQFKIINILAVTAKQHAEILDIDSLQTLYIKAADWYRQHGETEKMAHFYQLTARSDLIHQCFSLKEMNLETVQSIILNSAFFPGDNSGQNSEYNLFLISRLICSGNYKEADQRLRFNLKRLTNESPIQGELHGFIALNYLLQGQLAYAEYYKKAAAYLGDCSKYCKIHQVILISNSSVIGMRMNEAQICDLTCSLSSHKSLMADFFGDNGNTVELILAAIYFTQSKFVEAETFLSNILAPKNIEEPYLYCSALFLLLRTTLANGQIDKIEAYLPCLQEIMANGGATMIQAISAWYYLEIGSLPLAEMSIKSVPKERLFQQPYAYIYALFFLKTKKLPELLSFLDKLIGRAQTGADDREQVEFMIIQATGFCLNGDIETAFQLFENAYTLAQQSKTETPFIELGNEIKPLLHYYRSKEDSIVPEEWLNKIARSAELYGGYVFKLSRVYNSYTLPQHQWETLFNQNEINIMTLLYHEYSNPEIANIQNISINTLKRALKRIYRKLGADTKEEALQAMSAHGFTAISKKEHDAENEEPGMF